MAAGSSEGTSASREFSEDDLGDLCDALHKVSTKYRFFGLKIGLKMHEIRGIAAKHSDSADRLLEILSARLNQESALTCAGIVKALKSTSVSEHSLAIEFQKQFENIINKGQTEEEKVFSKKTKAVKSTESEMPSEKHSERIENVNSDDELKSDENEDIKKSAEVERQVHERDEPKLKKAKKRARKKERTVKSVCASEQPVYENAIQLSISNKESERIENVESEYESKSDESANIQKPEKSAEIERQVHERHGPKSKRAKKRACKREKNQCASEQPEPDEYKEDERKQMKGKQKQKMLFSEMTASPQSGAEYDQKRNKSTRESEKIVPQIISTDSEIESSDACKEKKILSTKSEKTGSVRKCGVYSEVKHQPQSPKIREVKNEARKKGKTPEKEGSTKKQHSFLHRKTAVAVESDEDTSEQPSHKSKKRLEAEETESEESFSESSSDESETENPKHKEKVKPKSPTHTEEMYDDSNEEIEKVRAKEKKKMPQKSKVATAKSSPHSERLVEKEQYKQKKGKRSVDTKEQERESELKAKANRRKPQKPHSQVKERERVKETDSGMKAKRLVAHSSEQASNKCETDCENEESDSGNESSEDGEDSEGKSSDEEEKTENDEESSTAPSEEEVKKKKKEKSVSHEKEKAKKEGFEEERKLMEKRVSKALVEQSKYDSPQRGRQFDETHTRKVKGKRESEAASLKYGSPGDDEQSDPGHGSRDQEEHEIQQRRRKNKKQRRESSMSPTANGSSSPSTSQEEKKTQPVSKKHGHRKKHVRKMEEKRKRMKGQKEKAACSSGTDDSSPECDMTKNQYEGEMKELVNIFEQFFGQLCCIEFKPKDIAAKFQKKGLISKAMMRDMMLSPESQQAKIIALIDELDKKTRSHPDCLFMIIEVMLENEALQETAREILSEAGTQYLVCALHFVLDSKTLFPAGRLCPVETAAKFPSQVPPSDTAVPSTADNTEGM